MLLPWSLCPWTRNWMCKESAGFRGDRFSVSPCARTGTCALPLCDSCPRMAPAVCQASPKAGALLHKHIFDRNAFSPGCGEEQSGRALGEDGRTSTSKRVRGVGKGGRAGRRVHTKGWNSDPFAEGTPRTEALSFER